MPALLALWLGVLVAACERDPTQLLVVVRSDYPSYGVLTEVRIEATDPTTGGAIDTEPDVVSYDGSPFSFAVVPRKGDPSTEARVVLRGLTSDGGELVTASARAGFVEHQTLHVPMHLWSVCEAHTCPMGQTCVPEDAGPSCEDEQREGLEPLPPFEEPAPVDAGAEASRTWGHFAAALPVEPCPPGLELVVTTAEDEADGGPSIAEPAAAGPALSFREAMTIASNRSEDTTVLFDERVFPAHSPGHVELACGTRWVASRTCIDARSRGVVIAWPEGCEMGQIQLIEGSLLIGVATRHMPLPILVHQSSVAGCRLNTDGVQALPGPAFFDVDARDGAHVGPGNVLLGRWGLAVSGTARVTSTLEVSGNFFGFDPVAGRALGVTNAIDPGDFDHSVALTLTDNVFVLRGSLFANPTAGSDVLFRGNWVGTDRAGLRIRGEWWGVGGMSQGSYRIEDNVIRGTSPAAIVVGGGSALITRNRIYDNAAGIVFSGPPPFDPPAVFDVNATEIAGTCPTPGTVEVFSDEGAQGEQYLGEATCDGDWILEVDVPRGRNVTATLSVDALRTSAFSAPVAAPE